MNAVVQQHLESQQLPRKRERTYMLRLAAEMFKNMDAVKLHYAHGVRALHCEVLNPYDGATYEVVIIPPGETHEHHSLKTLKEITNGNEKNIRGAGRAPEKALALGSC